MSTCQVWWARADDAGPDLDGLLAPEDLTRRARLRQDGDRRRTTVATAVVRTLLGATLGVAPADVPIDRTCPECGAPHGKPRLLGGPQFSVSHADEVVVVAVHAARAVGVDVEAVTRCTPDLAAILLPPGHPPAPAVIARAWVRAEAVAKATGQGLGGPPTPARVALMDLTAPAGFAASLAVLGSGPVRVHAHDAAQLLGQSSRRLPSATTRSQR